MTKKIPMRKKRSYTLGFSVPSQREADLIWQKAERLTEGNLSRLIRHAVRAYNTKVKKKD